MLYTVFLHILNESRMMQFYLLGADGKRYPSSVPGSLGGNSRKKIYGRLDCSAALNAIRNGPTYAKYRVFFQDEQAAINAGYRPCGVCMKDRYKIWKNGGTPGTAAFPWRVGP